MVSFRWTYRLKVNVNETAERAKRIDFDGVLLTSQSKRFYQEYPLNQAWIHGGKFNPNIKILVSPNLSSCIMMQKTLKTLINLNLF